MQVDVGVVSELDTRSPRGLCGSRVIRPRTKCDNVTETSHPLSQANPLISLGNPRQCDNVPGFRLCGSDLALPHEESLSHCHFVTSVEIDKVYQMVIDRLCRDNCVTLRRQLSHLSADLQRFCQQYQGSRVRERYSAANKPAQNSGKTAGNACTGSASFGQLAPRAAASTDPDRHRYRRPVRVSRTGGPVRNLSGFGRGLGARTVIIAPSDAAISTAYRRAGCYHASEMGKPPHLVPRGGSGVSRAEREDVSLRRVAADRGPSPHRNNPPGGARRLPAIVVGLYTLRNRFFALVRNLQTPQLTEMGPGRGQGGGW